MAGVRARVIVVVVCMAMSSVAPIVSCACDAMLRMAPDFTRNDLRGKPLSLHSYHGKLVLLSFWATWCEPCLAEVPVFTAWQTTYRAAGLQIVAVAMDDDSAPVKRAYAKYHMNYPVVMGDAQLAQLFGGVLGLPLNYLIDPDGRVVGRYQGELDLRKLESQINSLLPGPANGARRGVPGQAHSRALSIPLTEREHIRSSPPDESSPLCSADYGVPSEDADVFIRHKPEGSATGKRYVHRRPEYLRTVVDGVEALYAALQPFVSRSFAGPELDEQPMPNSIDLSGLNVSRACQLGKRRTAKLLKDWSGLTGSNRRPVPWQGTALPTELSPRPLGARDSMYTPWEVKASPASEAPRYRFMSYTYAIVI